MLDVKQLGPGGLTDDYSIVQASLHDSYVRAALTTLVNAVPYTQSEAFCRYVIQTDSLFIVTNSLSDGVISSGYNATGLIVDGVNVENGQQITQNGVIQSKAYPLAAGTKTIQMVIGPDAVVTTGTLPVRGIPVTGYSLQQGASHTIVAPTAPAKRIVVLSDSLSMGFIPNTGPNQASVFQAWPVLMRVNALASGAGTFAGAHLIAAGYGGARWADFSNTAPKVTTSVANMVQWLDGTGSNILIAALGLNDWGSGVSAASLQTNLATWADAFHTALPAVNIVFVTPVTTVNETNVNAGGSTLPQIRTAIGAVQAARAAYISLVAGPPLVTYPTNFYTDQTHLITPGMIQYEANLRAAMGIY